MSQRQSPPGHSNRPVDDRTVLPSISDWFPDEFSADSLPDIPSRSYQYFRRPGTLSPESPSDGLQQPYHHFHQSRPAPQPYHPHADIPRQFTPSSHARSASINHYLPQTHMSARLVRPSSTQSHYHNHGVRQTSDNNLLPSVHEAGPSSFTRTERHNPAQPGRSSPSSPSKYECVYCGKGFNRPSSLKTHINTHTGEKPFICPHEGCGRAFSVQSNMRRHARVHVQLSSRTNSDCSGDDESPSPSTDKPQS